MEEIIITGCNDCPFLYSDYDDYAVGHSTVDCCKLAESKHLPETIISVHDNFGMNENNVTPNWCPLIDNPLHIKYK